MHLTVGIDKDSSASVALNKVGGFLQSLQLSERYFIETLTLCSELINNIYVHTRGGSLSVDSEQQGNIVTITAHDRGDGLKNIDKVLQEGYSTAGSLGIGFPSIIRLSTELFVSTSSNGTTIVCKKNVA